MVSVIIPNYNHAPFLGERLDTVFSQTYQDFEVIILDDRSTDNSLEILQPYATHPKVSHFVANEVNSGSPFKQWKRGVSLAKGEWIWIAESDDIADPTFLERMMQAVAKHPSVGLAYSYLRWIDAAGKTLGVDQVDGATHYYTGKQFAVQKLLYTTTIYNVSSCIFRRDAFMQVDCSFFETMRCSGDYGFYAQMAQMTDVLEVKEVLTGYRQHASNTSRQMMKAGVSCQEDLAVLNLICDKYNIPQSKYAKFWARMQSFHHLPWSIRTTIFKAYWKKHPRIVLWSFYYLVYNLLRKIWRNIKR